MGAKEGTKEGPSDKGEPQSVDVASSQESVVIPCGQQVRDDPAFDTDNTNEFMRVKSRGRGRGIWRGAGHEVGGHNTKEPKKRKNEDDKEGEKLRSSSNRFGALSLVVEDEMGVFSDTDSDTGQ